MNIDINFGLKVSMEPMDIVGKTKEDASLPKGTFFSRFYANFVKLTLHIFNVTCL